MLIQTTPGQVADVVQNAGLTDYIDSDGNLQRDKKQAIVMVGSSADLANLTDYAPGTIAYTAGFGLMWQKSAAGEWEAI